MKEGQLESFVRSHEGNRPIHKVLISTNGIAAVKCIRSIRTWSYETFNDENAVKFLIMISPEDLDGNAEYIKMANQYCLVPGGKNTNNYANVDLIVEIALKNDVDAVWAGWGHASENPRLPEILEKNNIVFLGPDSRAMKALGDKIASSIVAQTAGVPTIGWNGSGIKLNVNSTDKHLIVPENVYHEACISSLQEATEAIEKIGLPVMIKASEGGGGKGIRIISDFSQIQYAYRQVQSEVPGSPIFIMKFVNQSRHLEVQLLGDKKGNIISLFGRDCSIQRRHQKIIEEAPVTIASRDMQIEMEKAAISLAKLVGYTSAGTIEYLYDVSSNKFFFLELNPRLQVEHPCTEMVTGVNLPAAQLLIGMGIPLNRIKDIRKLYNFDVNTSEKIDFESNSHTLVPKGHCVAARITSENPVEGFLPSSGLVKEISLSSSSSLWGYFSVSNLGKLHDFSDSQFGHIFSVAHSRDLAREKLIIGLRSLYIDSDFPNTVEYLISLIETNDFKNNKFDTSWLDNLIKKRFKSEPANVEHGVITCAVHIAHNYFMHVHQKYIKMLEKGHYLPKSFLTNKSYASFTHDGELYKLSVYKSSRNTYFIELNDTYCEVEHHRYADQRLLLQINGQSMITAMKENVDGYLILINNKSIFFDKEHDPTILRSPSSGRVISHRFKNGDIIKFDQSYIEIEVMKMVMELHVNCGGKIKYAVSPGSFIKYGDILATMELNDHHKFKKFTTGSLKLSGFTISNNEIEKIKDHSDKILAISIVRLHDILNGYLYPSKFIGKHIDTMIENLKILDDPLLPLKELQNILSTISNLLPKSVLDGLKCIMAKYARNVSSITNVYPSKKIQKVIEDYINGESGYDSNAIEAQNIISEHLKKYEHGLVWMKKKVYSELFQKYLDIESEFSAGDFIDILKIKSKKMPSESIFLQVLSHCNIEAKNLLLVKLFETLPRLVRSIFDSMKPFLSQLSLLMTHEHKAIALKSRILLISSDREPFSVRKNKIEAIFISSLEQSSDDATSDLEKLTLARDVTSDVLPEFFFSEDQRIAKASLEVYAQQIFYNFTITALNHDYIISNDDKIHYLMIYYLFPISNPKNLKTKRKTSFSSLSISDTNLNNIEFTNFMGFHRGNLIIPICSKSKLEECFVNICQHADRLDFQDSGFSFENKSDLENSEQNFKHTILTFIVRFDSLEKEEVLSHYFYDLCFKNISHLINSKIRRITFVAFTRGKSPLIYSFRNSLDFKEDTIFRNLEPSIADHIEINRLANYKLERMNINKEQLYLFMGSSKNPKKADEYRCFVRSYVKHSDFTTLETSFQYLQNEGEKIILETFDVLEIGQSHPKFYLSDCNHIFVNFLPVLIIDNFDQIIKTVNNIITRYGIKLWKCRMQQAELRFNIKLSNQSCESAYYRIIILTYNKAYTDIKVYKEKVLENDIVLELVEPPYYNAEPASTNFHKISLLEPYKLKNNVESKRSLASKMSTTYLHDYAEQIKKYCLKLLKKSFNETEFEVLKENFKCNQLGLAKNNMIEYVKPDHNNNCCTSAWEIVVPTVEFAVGRPFILIGNDITVNNGAISVKDGNLFTKVVRYAIKKGYPLLYIACNSGAMMGISKNIMGAFKIKWIDDKDPQNGYSYIYLDIKDYEMFQNLVIVEPIYQINKGTKTILHYKIVTIVGEADGGVENLSICGKMAGELSRAYNKIFTCSIVSLRAVGIGAYLARLSQRIIQVENSPLLLTGFKALNDLLGRDVYTSNNQLGGTHVMHSNGIAHATAPDDYSAFTKFFNWLSYQPFSSKIPLKFNLATFNRQKLSLGNPMKTPDNSDYDTRVLIDEMFDKDSFDEIFAGWAKSILVGRAKLGSIPIGVIAPVTQITTTTSLSDPADVNSEEKNADIAPKVLFPDSSFKISQAINDFNKEGLPLFILCNFRGFSGGMRDMSKEILKFGSYIVDNLSCYEQPIISYIGPYSELRGGCWVVMDSCINFSGMMEMFADPTSKGSILEPSGLMNLKFKKKDLISTMKRIIPEKFKDTESAEEAENTYMNTFTNVACDFIELHDTPQRMLAKKVIKDIVPFKKTRKYFFWYLTYRLEQTSIYKKLKKFATEDVCENLMEKIESIVLKMCPGIDIAAENKYELLYEAIKCHNSKIIKTIFEEIKENFQDELDLIYHQEEEAVEEVIVD